MLFLHFEPNCLPRPQPYLSCDWVVEQVRPHLYREILYMALRLNLRSRQAAAWNQLKKL